MIVDEVKYIMEYIEEITQKLGDGLPKDGYYVEDGG